MLVSLRHRLVIMAMPKCASTALETALAGQMDMVLRGHPSVKHTPFRKYERFLAPYLESVTKEPLEVISLFREPEDWLQSWWRYRGRDGIRNSPKSTQGMSFDRFVGGYLDGEPGIADVGRQSRFVSNKAGALGANRLFRHDDMPALIGFLEERLRTRITLAQENVSPPARDKAGLSPAVSAQLRAELARDFEIYHSIG